MGLSRLDNFLKSVRGTILYVDPNSLDATDGIDNQGNSLTRPFRTIQRALIEAARFSYQRGLNNDRFGKTTILIYPGDHIIDNRPGWIPDGENSFKLRNGTTSVDFPPFDSTTSFDLIDPDNALYKFNSVHGGVIIPRGTSLVGMDLRKTKLRPKYVPNPVNDNIEKTSIFRVTGGCYFWQFSVFDSDPNGQCYVDYTNNLFVPNFSHHKLTCFEYADGVNNVSIKDTFYPSGLTYDRTDLDMYYEKIGIAYGESSGRPIEPDYPSIELDIEPKIDEYRIVGSTGLTVGITSIRAGNGITPTNTITFTTLSPVPGMELDTPIRIDGVEVGGFNGQYVISNKIDDTTYQYKVQNPPVDALPSATGSLVSIASDTVNSASPYIFNISLRSVYGMCGLLADGDKASGFKSMVVAQFTGIGLQKDDNAFVIYNPTTGLYEDNTKAGNENLSSNSRALFKPQYRNYHIKCINDAFIQNVSVFAIGFHEHFSTDNGGDQSITNSNSNFGAKSLVSKGYKRDSFAQDDFGVITHIIPPKEVSPTEFAVEFGSIDVEKVVGVATTNERLYLYGEVNSDIPPEHVIEGYRVGAKENDMLHLDISINGSVTQYSSRIVMQNSQSSSEKLFYAGRSLSGINSISNNTITLTENHSFENGETIRIISDNGHLPDGLIPNSIYYAITNNNPLSGISSTSDIRLAKNLNDAKNGNPITINSKGGLLKIVSRVSDKNPGQLGHPIQFDEIEGQWYVKVSTSPDENTIHTIIGELGTDSLGKSTPRSYLNRKKDNRNLSDRIYRLRYVIPAQTGGLYARPPSDGFIIQESNSSIGLTSDEIQTYFGSGSLNNINQQRNYRLIANANWSNNSANVLTELPHNLSIGSEVELVNIKSSLNENGSPNSGYNYSYTVTGITSSREFVVALDQDPGTFSNDTTVRDTNLPYFKRKKYPTTYYIQQNKEVQRYIPGKQDGIYYLTALNASNSPTVSPFTGDKFAQPIKDLYPQVNRDTPQSDPKEAKSFSSSELIGDVIIDDVQNSITKETITKILKDTSVGFGITDIKSISSSTHDVFTSVDHGFNRITKVSIASTGSSYVPGTYYNAKLVGFIASPSGSNATAKVVIDSYGSLSEVQIMHGGSAYGIGNTLSVVGIATTSGYVPGVVNVDEIYDNVGDVVAISGVSSESYGEYNNIYRIVQVKVGAAKSFVTSSSSNISGFTTTGIGRTFTSDSFAYLTGKSVGISTIKYNPFTGIATVVSSDYHGFHIDNKVRLSGSGEERFNGDFVIQNNVGLTSFTVNVGVSTQNPTSTDFGFIYPEGITSNDGVISLENENISGRLKYLYGGITSKLQFEISDSTTDEITISDIEFLDIKIGDYLQINDEIVRVRDTVSPSITQESPIIVFRGALGTIASSHRINTSVKKILVYPVELRRNSIIRASGHTFEYVGFGPGNYSTAFPDKQDRQISAQEELLSQSTRMEGGVNFYTGMNDKGVSYAGNKKTITVTGEEQIFDIPILTFTGDDIGNDKSISITNSSEGYFTRSIRVDGGENENVTSEFNGPVLFSDKITSTSPKGIEAVSLFLQGDAAVSRKHTVGISTPVQAGNPGDVHYNAIPTTGDYIGWVYTNNNRWEKFGRIFPYSENAVGVSADGNFVGVASNINIEGSGPIRVSGSFGTSIGIATITISSDTIAIGIAKSQSYIGLATQIDFQARNLELETEYDSQTGISTITFVGLGTTSVYRGTQFIKENVPPSNFLKAGGDDAQLTYSEVTNALGFVPANSSSISGEYPLGNSIIIDNIDQSTNGGPFDGLKTDFTMKINGTEFIPAGNSANILVSIGGVIQKPGSDYIIVQTAGSNTSTIRFSTAPQAGKSHFIIALGGQGALLSDLSWNAQAELVAGVGNNSAAIVSPGADGTLLTIDTTVGTGVSWRPLQTVTTTSTNKTLVNREYCVVTSDNTVINLPINPQPGWFVNIDNAGTFNNVSVGGNGSLIMGLSENMIIDVYNSSVGFIFINSSLGWRLF